MNRRGGRRAGAGRKPSPRTERIYAAVSPEVKAWLQRQPGSLGEVIERMVRGQREIR
jgi:hypothetical protein